MIKFLIFIFNSFFLLPFIRIFFPEFFIDLPFILIYILTIDEIKLLNFFYLFIFGILNDYFSKIPLTFLLLLIYFAYAYLRNKINFSLLITKLLRDVFLFIPLIFFKGYTVFLFSFLIFFIIHIVPWKRILMIKF